MGTSDSNSERAAPPGKRSWRRHSAEFRARVIELARQPGTSVAAVALANGLNANMLRRWVKEAVGPGSVHNVAALPAFVQLPMPQEVPAPAEAASSPANVLVEIRRGSISVHASLPLDGRSAAWLREVLG